MSPQIRQNYDRVVSAGIHFDDFYRGALLLQAQRKGLFSKLDQIRFDVAMGNLFRYELDYHLNRGKHFSPGFRSAFQYNDINTRLINPLVIDSTLFLDEILFSYVDFTNEANIALYKGANSLTEIAGGIKHFRIDSDQLETNRMSNFLFDDSWYATLEGRYFWDNMDSEQFAMSGSKLKAKVSFLKPFNRPNSLQFSDNIAVNLHADLEHYWPMSDRFSFGIKALAGFNFSDAAPALFYTFGTANRRLVNNFFSFPGLTIGSAVGQSALMVNPFARLKLSSSLYATVGGQGVQLFDPVDQIIQSRDQVFGGYMGLGFSTIIGPVEGIFGFSEDESVFYINVGHWF